MSAAGEMLVCADLGSAVFFWFDPQRKQLAFAFWILPAALTMNRMLDAVRKNEVSVISIGQTRIY